jgi:hypothetical protein
MGRLSVQKIAVVVTGLPLDDPYGPERAFAGLPIIYSTWPDVSLETRHPIIRCTPPNVVGAGSLGYQVTSTVAGVRFAKFLGYEYVLRWRFDLVPSNTTKLLQSFKVDQFNVPFLCNYGDYYVDYCMMGTVDDMLAVWDITDEQIVKAPFPERILTDRIRTLNKRTHFFGESLSLYNDILWDRPHRSIRLSSYKTHPHFQTHESTPSSIHPL